MKKITIIMSILIAFITASTLYADESASWSAPIKAVGQNLGGMNEYEVIIGVGANQITEPAPPSPPIYSVKMELMVNESLILKDIQKDGLNQYVWQIAIDPHGNVGSPEARTATLSWDPAQLGAGSVELINEDGQLIADMKTVNSAKISGMSDVQYLSVVYTPE